MIVRPATLSDLAALTEIHNLYVVASHITFDVRPWTADDAATWFRDHSDGPRHRLLLAEGQAGAILGYAGTGAFRTKEAYETTVEITVACHPDATGQGIGTSLYAALFPILDHADVHLVVAGIAQPNPASNALHARFGFAPVGTFHEVGRKFGRYWDVRWMEKSMGHDQPTRRE